MADARATDRGHDGRHRPLHDVAGMLKDDSNVHLSYAPYLWAMLAVGQPPPSSSLDRS
jgi:hypothetical protein